MSIAQNLPYDVLEWIFTCCWRIKKSGDRALIEKTDFPILLLRICSSWRSAALSTPILWSILSLSFGDSTGDLTSFDGVMDRSRILDPWLELIGRGPKCLELKFNWGGGPVYDFMLPEASCEDIQHLILFCSPPIVHLLPEGSSLPRLETLVLFLTKEADVREYILAPHSASQLRKLWLQGVEFPQGFMNQRQSWTHLTHLILEDAVSSLSPIFHSCPQLEEAVLTTCGYLDPWQIMANPPTPAIHHSITKLTLYAMFDPRATYPGDIVSYFHGWYFPVLVLFHVNAIVINQNIFRDWPALMKCMPSLREVCLSPGEYHQSVNEKEIYDAFNAFNPLLDTLILDQSGCSYLSPMYAHPFSSVTLLRNFLLTRSTSRGSLTPIKKLIVPLCNSNERVIEISQSLLESLETNLDFLVTGDEHGGGGGLELELSLAGKPYLTMFTPCIWHHSTARWREDLWQQLMKECSTYCAFSVE